MKRQFVFASGLLAGVVLCAMLVSALWLTPVGAQSNLTTFTNLRTTGDMTVGDDLTVNDDLTVVGDTSFSSVLAADNGLTVSDGVTLTGNQVNTPGTVIVVTNGMTITPLSAYQPLSATGNVGTSAIGGCVAGKLVTFVNQANVTITITDTGNIRASGNAALGQWDSVTFRCHNGTVWVEVGETNN